jgi:DNA-binding beta-propeller fold protein YncE
MRRFGRVCLPAVASVALSAAAALSLGDAAAASALSRTAGGAGSQLWVSSYNGTGHGFDVATATVASPDGGVVFVTGRSAGTDGNNDYATVAYNSATGVQLWVSRFSQLGGGIPLAIGISPDGGTVYVTGQGGGVSSLDYVTVAYDANNGAQKWVGRYNGPNNSVDVARSLAVSPDGRTVYVTGYSGGSGDSDYVTIAYNAATGARRWLSRYNGRAGGNDQARAVTVSADGRTVYVTGRSQGKRSGYDIATVACNAATGARLWVARYNGPANLNDFGTDLAVSPSGRVVYVTGGTVAPGRRLNWVTIAYNTAGGQAVWSRQTRGWSIINNVGSSVGVTPSGRTVMVANYTTGTTTRTAYAITAYVERTGASRWSRRYAGPAGNNDNLPAALGISPDGSTVYVTGTSDNPASENDYATVAYSIFTGARLWVSRFTGLGNSFDQANALAVNPKGGPVYVTGSSSVGGVLDFATVAYRAG